MVEPFFGKAESKTKQGAIRVAYQIRGTAPSALASGLETQKFLSH